MRKLIGFFALCMCGILASASASAASATSVAPATQSNQEILAHIRAQTKNLLPNQAIDKLHASPIPGLYEVSSGTHIFYATQDGRYLLSGELLDLTRPAGEQNLSELARREARMGILKSTPLNPRELVVYKTKETPKGVMTVFTDPDCFYCRKLHEELPQLMAEGIEVRYAAFPRQGAGSPAYNKLRDVWCATDRSVAFNQVIKGEALTVGTCSTPIDQHLALVEKLGISGTPAIMFPDGTVVLGYRPSATLLAEALKHQTEQ